MLSPKPDQNIPWYRPTKYIRAFLSWKIWLPLANLTFTFYLFHGVVLTYSSQISKALILGGRELPSNDPEVLVIADCNEAGVGFSNKGLIGIYMTNAALAISITLIISIFIYVFIEKQGINARSAFKSKWQKGAVKVQD
tara:strand:+ start:212 stop:628 length:417 start_codon:yes stop_codon:yes gene_type:complete